MLTCTAVLQGSSARCKRGGYLDRQIGHVRVSTEVNYSRIEQKGLPGAPIAENDAMKGLLASPVLQHAANERCMYAMKVHSYATKMDKLHA